ncbi:MMPL family transporter [Ruania albidiflava]|uniref:MMPL family transporter n=1 Tax=Ruania albidiflava TaxID=366586 RepID=UPI0003B7396E|nr:MMPL family transporter [Ruania albidiflava]
MFDRLGRTIARHPLLTVLCWIVLVAVTGGLALTGFGGQGLFDRLHSGEPVVPGSESQEAREILAEVAEEPTTVTAIVRGVDLTDQEELSAAGRAITTAHSRLVAVDGVEQVADPFVFTDGLDSEQAAPFLAADGDGFLISITLDGAIGAGAEASAEQQVIDHLTAFERDLGDDARVLVSSNDLLTDSIVSQMQSDLTRGEAVALPISLLVMVIVFGGFLAAGMPLAGAIASIAGGLGALLGFSHLIELDSVVVNVVTVLGLGLSIDYGLLIVSRYREEIRREVDAELADTVPGERRRRSRRRSRRRDPVVERALRTTLSTAGRTVTFSALTVAIAIAGLLLLRPEILKSLGAAGVSVVVIAVASALTLVPALLRLRGRRMLRPPLLMKVPGLRRLLGTLGETAPTHGVFSRLAGGVQRRPWLVMLAVTAVLVFLASPLLGLSLRNTTTEMVPEGTEQREFLTVLEEQYPAFATPTAEVLVAGSTQEATAVAEEIATLPDVTGAQVAEEVNEEYQVIGVHVDTDDPGGEVATEVVRGIRDLDPAPASQHWVMGQAANQLDFTAALLEGLPLAAGIVVLATFVLLFLMTGSLLVPLKALIVNALSLCASLGLTTWIFQDGNLSGLFGFTPVGGLEAYVVAVVVAFGFGLAMDYEVFLIARIKEFYDGGQGGIHRGDNEASVSAGLQRSGRIITSAALVIIVVFAGFATGELLPIKEVGVALAVTVLIDATLVRMLLVPSTMTLLGRRNWWAPKPLARAYQRFGIHH